MCAKIDLGDTVAFHDPATAIESTPRMARMEVQDRTQVCEVGLFKEAIGPPTRLSVGPVLAIDDAIGLKMRALHNRTTHRDFIDVRTAATSGYSVQDLERFGAITELRSWAAGWEADLRARQDFDPGSQPASPEPDWDAYLHET